MYKLERYGIIHLQPCSKEKSLFKTISAFKPFAWIEDFFDIPWILSLILFIFGKNMLIEFGRQLLDELVYIV